MVLNRRQSWPTPSPPPPTNTQKGAECNSVLYHTKRKREQRESNERAEREDDKNVGRVTRKGGSFFYFYFE